MFTTCRLGILMNTNKENGAQVILNKDTFVIRTLIVITYIYRNLSKPFSYNAAMFML